MDRFFIWLWAEYGTMFLAALIGVILLLLISIKLKQEDGR